MKVIFLLFRAQKFKKQKSQNRGGQAKICFALNSRFLYLEKTQKKKIFETNLRVIGLSRALQRKNPKMPNMVKNRKKRSIFNIFQKFQKHVKSYLILYQNAKFGGPGVNIELFRTKKLILRISENIWYLRLKFLQFFFHFLSPPSVFALET